MLNSFVILVKCNKHIKEDDDYNENILQTDIITITYYFSVVSFFNIAENPTKKPDIKQNNLCVLILKRSHGIRSYE